MAIEIFQFLLPEDMLKIYLLCKEISQLKIDFEYLVKVWGYSNISLERITDLGKRMQL